jgi:hypothetical protein
MALLHMALPMKNALQWRCCVAACGAGAEIALH